MALRRCADGLILGEMMLFLVVQDNGADFAELVKRSERELGIDAPMYCSGARIKNLLDRKFTVKLLGFRKA